MKKVGEKHSQRLIAWLLSLVMLLSVITVPAYAQADWSEAVLTLSWTDAAGNVMSVTAEPVLWSQDQSFWAMVTPDAPITALTLDVMHPRHAYTYELPEGYSMQFLMDAGYEMNVDTVLPIMLYENGAYADMYNLYVSTQMMPQEAVPQVREAQVRVLSRTEDGSVVLNDQYVTVTSDAPQTFWAGAYDGYELISGDQATVYVDENGNASQGTVEFIYRALPRTQYADVQVIYRTEDGAVVLGQQTVTVSSDAPQTFWATNYEGYELVSADQATVTVDENGNASSYTVEFIYRAVPQIKYADVQVIYRTEDGATVLEQQTVTVGSDAPQTFWAKAYEGYELVSADQVTVTVDENGNASASVVEFLYHAIPTIGTADIHVVSRTEDGSVVLNDQYVTVTSEAPQTIWAGAYEGYELISADQVTVTVDVYGNADVTAVEFIYRAIPQIKYADVQVTSRTEDGATVLDQQTVTVGSDAPQTVWAGAFGGYELISADQATITVNENGEADPAAVEFIYRAIPQVKYADVLVIYRTEDNVPLEQQIVTVSSDAPQTLDAKNFADYELTSPAQVQVSVNGDGVPSQATVEFIYRAIPQIVQAEVTVYWRTQDGETIFESESAIVSSDAPATFRARQYEGYQLVSADQVQVTVDASGTPSVNPVVFFYVQIPPQVVVMDAPVVARDTDNNMIEQWTVQVTSEQPVTVEARSYEHYQLVSEAQVTVSVSGDGALSHNPVEFVYMFVPPATDAPTEPPVITEAPAPTEVPTAVITVYHRDAWEQDIVEPQTVVVEAGSSMLIRPDENLMNQAGYDIETADPQSVVITVGVDGVPSTDHVVFHLLPISVETPIPLGELINRWGVTTSGKVNVRTEPKKSSKAVATIQKKGSKVWVIREEPNGSGETWYRVILNGKEGFVRSDFILVLTQRESDQEQASLKTPVPETRPEDLATATPTPTEVPVPTEAPTETPTETPTAPVVIVPTNTPTPEPVQTPEPTPTATPVPTSYIGYALTSERVELRDGIEFDSSSFITALKAGTLVYVKGQTYDGNSVAWSQVEDLESVNGYVQHSKLRAITNEEAKTYIDLWNQQHPTATPTPVPTNAPAQVAGYAYTIGDNVPFRQTCSDRSVILALLDKNVAVYVSGQEYNTEDGWPWHMVQYNGYAGYIRSDMLRMMTADEVEAYWNSKVTPQPTVEITPEPYNENTLSSYGYIFSKNGNSVNVRANPSTGASKVGSIYPYALCLVMGSQQVNGVTWYKIQYNGVAGYVHGDYFKHMSLAELSEFLTSEEYKQGVNKNTSAGATAAPTTSVENQNATQWNDKNSNANVNYATWAPIATTAPLTTPNPALPTMQPADDGNVIKGYVKTAVELKSNNSLASTTLEKLVVGTELTINSTVTDAQGTTWYNVKLANGRVGFVDAASVSLTELPSPEASASPTISFAPVATMDAGGGDENKGGSMIGWIIAVIVVLLGGAGVYGYMTYQNNKRRAAQRAAQRRAQAAKPVPGGQRPDAAAQANRPRTGTYSNVNAPAQQRPAANGAERPAQPQQNGQTQARRPYAGTANQTPYQSQFGKQPTGQNGYARPAAQSTAQNVTGYAPAQQPGSTPAAENKSPYANPYAQPVATQSAPAAKPEATEAEQAAESKRRAEEAIQAMMAEIQAKSESEAVKPETETVKPEPEAAKAETTEPAKVENAAADTEAEGEGHRSGRRMARRKQMADDDNSASTSI